jgi:predicted RNase H-like HicB family nuclease
MASPPRAPGEACSPSRRFGYNGAMRLPILLERDETGMIVATCPAIPGCVSQGSTDSEALANIREAIVGCLEVRAEEGLPLTVRVVDIEVAVA